MSPFSLEEESMITTGVNNWDNHLLVLTVSGSNSSSRLFPSAEYGYVLLTHNSRDLWKLNDIAVEDPEGVQGVRLI